MKLAEHDVFQLCRTGVPEQKMVVAAPDPVFDLALCGVQLPLNASDVVDLKLAQQATVGVIRHGLPREQFFHPGPQRSASFTGHPQNAARIPTRLLPALARPIRDALMHRPPRLWT